MKQDQKYKVKKQQKTTRHQISKTNQTNNKHDDKILIQSRQCKSNFNAFVRLMSLWVNLFQQCSQLTRRSQLKCLWKVYSWLPAIDIMHGLLPFDWLHHLLTKFMCKVGLWVVWLSCQIGVHRELGEANIYICGDNDNNRNVETLRSPRVKEID